MAVAGFYNENEYRQYPFVGKQTYLAAHLPTQLIVDCGFIMGIDSQFDATTHIVYLSKLTVTEDEYIFEFRTTAPAAAAPLIFTRNKTAENWEIEYQASAVASDKPCATEPAWEGFIVTGNLQFNDAQEEKLNDGEYEFAQERVVEPALIQSLVRNYLRSIGVANYERTVLLPCSDNSSSSSSAPVTEERALIPQQLCMNGNIKFTAGYNCSITQTDIANTITISPFLGAGAYSDVAAELCENFGELPLYVGEPTAPGSKFLSGGPACDELITSINGIGGPNVIINNGPGITIRTSDNKIIFGVDNRVIAKEC